MKTVMVVDGEIVVSVHSEILGTVNRETDMIVDDEIVVASHN